MGSKYVEAFSNALRILIEQKELSYCELEKQLGISDTSLWRYANGKLEPPLRIAVQIANFFGLEIEEMLELGARKNDL